MTLDEDIFEIDSLGTNCYLLKLLSGKLSRAVFQLVLSRGLWLELPLHKFVRHKLLFGAHFILVVDRLILRYRSFNIQRLDSLVGLEFRYLDIVVHAKIEVFFDFLESFRRRFTSFFHFLSNTVVNRSIDAFMLDVVVESLLISLICKVCLNFESLCLVVNLVEVSDCWIFFGLFATDSLMQRRDCCLLIVD